MYELPCCLKLVCVYHLFKVVKARWFNLVHSLRGGSGLNKKRKESKKLPLLNLLTLFYVHQSSVSTVIVQMRQTDGYYSLKK